jgi:hypothetical protein
MKAKRNLNARIDINMFHVVYDGNEGRPWRLTEYGDASPEVFCGQFSSYREAIQQARHRATGRLIR